MKILIKYSHVTYYKWENESIKKVVFLGAWQKVRDVKGKYEGYPVKIFNKTLKVETDIDVKDIKQVIIAQLEKEVNYNDCVWC